MHSTNHKDTWMDNRHPTDFLPKTDGLVNSLRSKNQSVVENYTQQSQYMVDRSDLIMQASSEHLDQQREQLQKNMHRLNSDILTLLNNFQNVTSYQDLWQDWLSYSMNSQTRLLQTADILRERGDIVIEHEKAGCPPVLDYDYDVVMDATTFKKRPCNYVLLRILSPDGIKTEDKKRPYVVIDPRAGHGGGIGGFKSDSQVGVALADGHPVYFVAFKRMPEPTQTIADVTHAEGKFIRKIRDIHPDSPAPVIVGNCQGGWATLVLAATNPEITGPIVMNGAPVSAWSGRVGTNPMRYKAGIFGGTWQALLTSDLSNGLFDGAWLVHNFEQLNPSRNYVGKYYDLYKNPMPNKQRFLDFERWWGGFFFMTEQEIKWIVENIFIGNRLARNTAQLEKGTNIDLRNIKAPIIIFASRGDNITPPQQAINWILDTYVDENEIAICGQRIIYMLHEQVGHLGIFVSSKIAKREHKGIASILEMIEALPPGLFELVIEDHAGEGHDKTFSVDFQNRTFNDIKNAIGDNRNDEKAFRAIHRFSKTQTRAYENFVRPYIKSISNDTTAHWQRVMHPLRLQRTLWNSQNPMAKMVSHYVKSINPPAQKSDNENNNNLTDNQHQQNTVGVNVSANLIGADDIESDNVFLNFEKLWMDSVTISLDLWRDWQGIIQESLFFSIWSMPWLRVYGQKEASRRLIDADSLKETSTVESALAKIEEGGLSEAVVRMLSIANEMGLDDIDRDQLMRFTEVLSKQKPFSELTHDELADILHQQTIIVRFDEQNAVNTLPKLLMNETDKNKALEIITFVLGNDKERKPSIDKIMARFNNVLTE